MEITIRELKEADYSQCKQIGMTCFDKQVDPDHKNILARLLFLRYFSKRKFKERKRLNVEMFGVDVNGVIVGFYELEAGGLLASLYVDENYRHLGYGKALLKHALKKAKEIELEEVRLESSEYAVKFYERFGFKKDKKPYELLGVKMVLMKIKVV